jgi:hypothetical protein
MNYYIELESYRQRGFHYIHYAMIKNLVDWIFDESKPRCTEPPHILGR